MAEYYVKIQGSAEATGPFNENELKEFFRAGKIDGQTPHFYDDIIGWKPIKANDNLFQILLGEDKPHLTLKKMSPPPKAVTSTVNVESMLQSAERGSKNTRTITEKKRWEDRVAALSMPILAILNLLMGILLMFADWKTLVAIFAEGGSFNGFLMSPGLALGVVIFSLGILLFLSLASVYPAVRYAAFIFLGYMGILSWSYLYEGMAQGWLLMGAGMGFGIGVYTITLTLNFKAFCLSTMLAIGGLVAYSYFLFFA